MKSKGSNKIFRIIQTAFLGLAALIIAPTGYFFKKSYDEMQKPQKIADELNLIKETLDKSDTTKQAKFDIELLRQDYIKKFNKEPTPWQLADFKIDTIAYEINRLNLKADFSKIMALSCENNDFGLDGMIADYDIGIMYGFGMFDWDRARIGADGDGYVLPATKSEGVCRHWAEYNAKILRKLGFNAEAFSVSGLEPGENPTHAIVKVAEVNLQGFGEPIDLYIEDQGKNKCNLYVKLKNSDKLIGLNNENTHYITKNLIITKPMKITFVKNKNYDKEFEQGLSMKTVQALQKKYTKKYVEFYGTLVDRRFKDVFGDDFVLDIIFLIN